MLQVLIPTLVAVFLLGSTVPELLRRARANPAREPISFYLTGPYHVIEDAGFGALALAVVLAGSQLAGIAALVAFIIAAAIVLAMVSDTWGWLLGKDHHRIHVMAAVIAFLAALVFEAWVSIRRRDELLIALMVLYPVAAALTYWRSVHRLAWSEKVSTGAVCLWLAVWSFRL